MTRRVGIALIAGGIAAAVTGELLGVFFDSGEPDTVTDFVTWVALETHGLALVPVVGLLGWAAVHFVDSYRNAKRG